MPLNRTLCALTIATTCFMASAYADDTFDLQTLIDNARQEAPITVYAPTGKIVQQAEDFTEKYGVSAVGVKAKAAQTIEIVSRGARANNVQADVVLIEDAPGTTELLLEPHHVSSWAPEDMTDDIIREYQDPLAVILAPNVWAYNTAEYDSCPITNIWQLTEDEWRHKVTLQDPAIKPLYIDWFNQMATHHDQEMAEAFHAFSGKPLDTDEASATAEFVKRLAQNGPLMTPSDSEAAEAIGTPDAGDSFVGLISTAAFRDNNNGLALGICHGLEPFIGISYPTFGLMTTQTRSPNAAKLFLHYLMTEEGIKLQSMDGKMSTNTTFALPAEEASGIEQFRDQLMMYRTATAGSDWENRQDWLDLWGMNYSR
ncbi:ABC transporter substrate-binding protein [Halomonas aquamarina]|uniref:ABC transporter substrate-binding protein n=1 Tax=Vreelandella aquamarina TaxID=77097 RepID=A0ACC5VPL8_9GAMM|nr:ABC transporter substrate-binding protein [Halomonas aquamarina]MBZ5486198.1 ABC transporter substrate-binding protein [Halomonas aquamarina]